MEGKACDDLFKKIELASVWFVRTSVSLILAFKARSNGHDS